MKKTVLFFVFSALVFGFLLFPEQLSQATKDGLSLAARAVVPSLFPLSVISGVIVRLRLMEGLCGKLSGIMNKVFLLPECAAIPAVLGLLGGYPLGAQIVSELYREGGLSKKEAERTLAFCNNAGPSFVIGTVGGMVFGDVKTGAILFLIHAASALTTGAVVSRFAEPPNLKKKRRERSEIPGISAAFTAALQNSVNAMLRVTGFIAFFSFVMGLVRLPGFDLGGFEPILYGALEMTGGLFTLPNGGEAVAATLIGFGGLCIFFQTAGFLEGTGISAKKYILGKFLQAGISFAAAKVVFEREYGQMIFVVAVIFTAILAARVKYMKKVEKKPTAVL